jgi:hypothetical protein
MVRNPSARNGVVAKERKKLVFTVASLKLDAPEDDHFEVCFRMHEKDAQ